MVVGGGALRCGLVTFDVFTGPLQAVRNGSRLAPAICLASLLLNAECRACTPQNISIRLLYIGTTPLLPNQVVLPLSSSPHLPIYIIPIRPLPPIEMINTILFDA